MGILLFVSFQVLLGVTSGVIACFASAAVWGTSLVKSVEARDAIG